MLCLMLRSQRINIHATDRVIYSPRPGHRIARGDRRIHDDALYGLRGYVQRSIHQAFVPKDANGCVRYAHASLQFVACMEPAPFP